MLPGETVQSGASAMCPECGKEMSPRVLRSAAGYYVGLLCCCGPYSRESGYYKTEAEAAEALKIEEYWR